MAAARLISLAELNTDMMRKDLMRPLLLAAVVVVLTATVDLSPAAAAASVSTAWQNLPQAGSAAQGGATATPHYEWQYHYAGRHPRLDGHWVLVR
jgi:hypothetical protein